MGRTAWRTRAVAVGAVALVVAAGIGFYRQAHDAGPEATGRPEDACKAKGPAGVVGLDAETGEVQWTNVVGQDVQAIWTPPATVAGDGEPHASVVDATGKVRTLRVDSGRVDACLDGAHLPPEQALLPTPIDGSGAIARNHGPTDVDVVEADETLRWQANGSQLLGGVPGSVVVRRDVGEPGAMGFEADPSVEVLEPATGKLRWEAPVAAVEVVVTEDHLLALECQACRSMSGSGAPSRITAYDLRDGSTDWDLELDGPVGGLAASGGLVFVSAREPKGFSAIDEGTGKLRWTTELPEPGRGGTYTDGSSPGGATVAGGTVVVVNTAYAPYRD